MALDFIGIGERGGAEGDGLLLKKGWPGRVPLSQSAL